MTLLAVEELTVQRRSRELISGLSLTVAPGQVVSLIGPNGAGKSTLLKAIAGDWAPSSGRIAFNDRALTHWPARERARAMAVLTQSNRLGFDFTAAEVVALGRTPHSSGAAADWRICREAMDAMDVMHLAQRLYPSLSGGEQQRVQLARVMAQIWRAESPAGRLLLLDEPVSALDLGHQRQLMLAVRAFAAGGAGVVMALHDISLAAAWSDRLVALKDGRGCARGTPEAVVTEAVIGELFDTRVRVLAHPDTGKPVVLGAQ